MERMELRSDATKLLNEFHELQINKRSIFEINHFDIPATTVRIVLMVYSQHRCKLKLQALKHCRVSY